jgi:hypothetical protein
MGDEAGPVPDRQSAGGTRVPSSSLPEWKRIPGSLVGLAGVQLEPVVLDSPDATQIMPTRCLPTGARPRSCLRHWPWR